MKTLKDYKEKVLKEFEETYPEMNHSGLGWFIEEAIDNAVAEAFKVVEMEKVNVFDDEDYGYNRTIDEVEDRKKQYLV